MERMFYEPPLTVIHHDFQADNLLFGRASDSVPLVVIDWQMLTGRGPVDVAYLLSGSMHPEDRRRHELDLVTRYAVQLEAAGVRDYDAANAWRTTALPCCCRRSDWPLAVAYTPHDSPPGRSGTCYSSDRFAP